MFSLDLFIYKKVIKRDKSMFLLDIENGIKEGRQGSTLFQ